MKEEKKYTKFLEFVCFVQIQVTLLSVASGEAVTNAARRIYQEQQV